MTDEQPSISVIKRGELDQLDRITLDSIGRVLDDNPELMSRLSRLVNRQRAEADRLASECETELQRAEAAEAERDELSDALGVAARLVEEQAEEIRQLREAGKELAACVEPPDYTRPWADLQRLSKALVRWWKVVGNER